MASRSWAGLAFSPTITCVYVKSPLTRIRPTGISVQEQRFDATEVGIAKALAITELSPSGGVAPSTDPSILVDQLGLDRGHAGLVGYDVYESIYNPGKMLVLTAWHGADRCPRLASGGSGVSASPSRDAIHPRLWHVRSSGNAAILPGHRARRQQGAVMGICTRAVDGPLHAARFEPDPSDFLGRAINVFEQFCCCRKGYRNGS